MRLTPDQRRILRAMRDGATLRPPHPRWREGPPPAPAVRGPEPVDAALVESLRELGLIQSNLKFPAATYILTERGAGLPL